MKTSDTRSALRILLVTSLLAAPTGCGLFGGGKKGKKEKLPSDQSLSESDLANRQNDRFGSNSIPTAEAEGVFRDVRFDYDSASVSDQGQQDIESNVQLLQADPSVRVQLEGHTDERGTEQYNLELGQARARAVRDILVASGVEASRLEIISYGENVPLDPGHDDAAWAENRRVHFSAVGGGTPAR